METRQLYLDFPTGKPFDQDNWFETIVGSFVLPLVSKEVIHRYWFTRYSDGTTRQMRFRFELPRYDVLKPDVDALIERFGCKVIDNEPFDVVGDLSGVRFLGVNARKKDYRARGEMIFDYLHMTARLYLDTLSHSDQDGYWYREDNRDRGNNDKGDSFETYHHLLCNMTGVPTEVVYARIKETDQVGFFSRLYFKITQEHLKEKKQQTLEEVESFGHIQF